MDEILVYEEQLKQINAALSTCSDGPEKEELLSLKTNIKELLLLTKSQSNETNNGAECTDEYALFMAEMEKEGAINVSAKTDNKVDVSLIEGMKCRAPHIHEYGNIIYHNALVCSVVPNSTTNSEEIKVRVLFLNPTHKKMLPCPYYFDENCKFSDETCHFSHGEIVLFSSLQDYVEPKFENLTVGSRILAKQKNNLWYRAKIKSIFDETCLVKFESNQVAEEITFENLTPLQNCEEQTSDLSSDEESDVEEKEEIINMSLLLTPSKGCLGDWEKYTKGIGSKLMSKMGYIVGTGLGKKSDGRLEPVSAEVLPVGRSLDHCMKLRENAGGDKDLFSVERKLKRIQKKQEIRNKQIYEKEKNNKDIFKFINQNLGGLKVQTEFQDKKHRQEIKKESCRNLNVASLQIDENIKNVQKDLYKIQESLTRHKNQNSAVHKQLIERQKKKHCELKQLQFQALNIKNEQSLRSDKKKFSIF